MREVEKRGAAVAVKTKELEDREAVMVTRETAASAAIFASDSLRTQLEAAQKAREKAEGDLEKLKKERADEGSVRVELVGWAYNCRHCSGASMPPWKRPILKSCLLGPAA